MDWTSEIKESVNVTLRIRSEKHIHSILKEFAKVPNVNNRRNIWHCLYQEIWSRISAMLGKSHTGYLVLDEDTHRESREFPS